MNITEQEFLDMLITDTRNRLSLCHLLGWTVAHFRASRTKSGWRTAVAGDGKGFVDLVLVKATSDCRRTIFAELKRKGEKPEPEQRLWLDLLYDAGNETYLWYPEDIDEIQKVLESWERPKDNPTNWGNRR